MMSHIHEKIDFIVNAFIVHDNKILLVDHIKGGLWLPIGGHIELDEDPDMALFREIEEECGLLKKDLEVLSSTSPFQKDEIATPLYTPNFIDIHNIFSKTPGIDHRHVGLCYFIKSTSDKVKLEVEAHREIKWFTEKELDDKKYDLLEHVKVYAKLALKAARI